MNIKKPHSTATFDLSGLRCPHPILQIKKRLANLATGEIIKVICTDPDTPRDFERFCSVTGHQLMRSWQEKETFIFLIQKG